MKEEYSAVNVGFTIGGATVGVLLGLWIGIEVWGSESILVAISSLIGIIIGMLFGKVIANIIERR